jgi:hypothetical protein
MTPLGNERSGKDFHELLKLQRITIKGRAVSEPKNSGKHEAGGCPVLPNLSSRPQFFLKNYPSKLLRISRYRSGTVLRREVASESKTGFIVAP